VWHEVELRRRKWQPQVLLGVRTLKQITVALCCGAVFKLTIRGGIIISQWVCSWDATFAFHMRAFVALRLMLVARMPSFANGHLAE